MSATFTATTVAPCQVPIPSTASTSSSSSATTAIARETPAEETTGPTGALVPATPGHHNSNWHTLRQNHNSSKLPAFRFADLKKDPRQLPPPLQLHNHAPPTPVSPTNAVQKTADTPCDDPNRQNPATPAVPGQDGPSVPGDRTTDNPQQHPPQHHESTGTQQPISPPDPATTASQQSPPRSRSFTFTCPAPISAIPAATLIEPTKRPTSLPYSPSAPAGVHQLLTNVTISSSAVANPQPQEARASASSISTDEIAAKSRPPPTLNSRRLRTAEAAAAAAAHAAQSTENFSESPTKEWAQGQRERLLPETEQAALPANEKRTPTTSSRPPVSFKSPVATSSAPVRVPPIRAFRSSGSRRSVLFDMNTRSARSYDVGDDYDDSNQRDRTLRALEGRPDEDALQLTPPDSAAHTPNDEHTADLFMRIAREDSTRSASRESATADGQSTITTRMNRTSHRRPFSAAVPSRQQNSPPKVPRRLSDQQDRSRRRRPDEEQGAQHLTRELAYKAVAKDRSASAIYPQDEGARGKSASLRPSPITPRSPAYQDSVSYENPSPYSRRRQSITETNSGLPSRTSSYKQSNLSYAHPRMYNSSPLVPKQSEPRHDSHQGGGEMNNAREGTESTSSTAAPSTVWDELDELKSRIHRLELTGKMPSTSAAAVSRLSDERPQTSTTATTMSASPKRESKSGAHQAEVSSTTSSHREMHPLLHSALSKTRPFLTQEVFSALESAANDALSMSSMMGIAGQPGPISSGASTVGGGSLTDRQLRRKADSICRSLTELCLALSEDTNQQKGAAQPSPLLLEYDEAASPSGAKSVVVVNGSHERRSSIAGEKGLPKINTSPRALTRLEERRNSILNNSSLTSPRFTGGSTATPTEATRKPSLLINRTRRAVTEEPEEGRRSTMHLRTRRAGSEEPEEGRKTSLLLRGRRGTQGEEGEEFRFRAPSRATTEVNGIRGPARDFTRQLPAPETNLSPPSSALPRRRPIPVSLNNSRLIQPSTPTSAVGRRYFDRSTPERETSAAGGAGDDRSQRHMSLGQTAMMNRTTSVNRRSRENTSFNVATSASTGGYR